MPLISVITPVYNVEKFLRESIESILNQTLTDFELILVDDGSTDNSSRICDEYAHKDSRVVVVHKKNERQGAARNYGVKIARADLISFVDSDDCIDCKYLEILFELYKKTDSRIVCCSSYEGKGYSFQAIKNKSTFKTLYINDDEMAKLYKGERIYWVCWCKLIEKELLLKYPFPEGVYYEDNAIVFKWIYDCESISYTEEILYFYRINNNGTTKGPKKHIMNYVDALEKQVMFFADNRYTITAKLVFDEYLKLTSHLFFSKERKNKDAYIIKNRVSIMVKTYGYLLKKDDLYANRIIHPFVSYFYRIKRKIKKFLKPKRGF